MAKLLLNDAQGNPVYVDHEEAQTALANGYSHATREQQKAAELEDKNQQQYGEGLGNELKAGALGAAEGLTFGLSNQVLTGKHALFNNRPIVEPKTIKEIEERNPVSHGVGVAGGVLIPSVLTGGESLALKAGLEAKGLYTAEQLGAMTSAELRAAAQTAGVESSLGAASSVLGAGTHAAEGVGNAVTKAARAILPEGESVVGKVLSSAGSRALGSAAEGALYGAGNVIAEDALGDSDHIGEKLMGEMGYGALFGGALGSLFGAAEPFIGKEAAKVAGTAEDVAPRELTEAGIPSLAGETTAGVAPTSIEGLSDRVAGARMEGINPGELPSKKVLVDAESKIADSQFPVHELQLQSMDDGYTRDLYKGVRESNTTFGKDVRDYEALQKQEGVREINKSVDNLSPETNLTPDPHKGGTEIVDSFHELYKQGKKQDAEAFQVLKDSGQKVKVGQTEVLSAINKAIPDADLTEIFTVDKQGWPKIEPYKASMPISQEAHSALTDLVKAGKNGEMTLQELRNVRDSIGDRINFNLAPRAQGQLGSLKKNLMDLMQESVEKVSPDLELRSMFKRYAQNEQSREVMEKILGGKLDDRQGLLRAIKPEKVGEAIFRNSATIQEAKRILPPELFDRAVGNYLKEQIARSTNEGIFSSKKFGNFLRDNATELKFAFADKPEVLDRLNAWSDKLRILPDSVSHNPSGTAKALGISARISEAAKGAGHLLSEPHKVMGGFLTHLGQKLEQKAQVAEIQKIMAGSAEAEGKVSQLAKVERASNSVTNKIHSLAGRIFNSGTEMVHGVVGAAVTGTYERKFAEFKRINDTIEEKSNNPESYVTSVSKVTDPLYSTAPKISSGIQKSMTRATEFLKTKMPSVQPVDAFSKPSKPSDAELSKFFRYHSVVENPFIALKQIKTGTLSMETMDTLKNVYPKLLEEMRGAVMNHMTDKIGKKSSIPFNTKTMLSMFMEQDLIASLNQQNMAANQGSMHGPSQQQDNQPMQPIANKGMSGAKNITVANRYQTDMRATAERGEA